MTAMLEIDSVRKTIGRLEILAGVNLVLEEGAMFGLVGANGCGKTTLLNVISGFAIADVGRIRLAGREIGASRTWLRASAGLGRTFQSSRLWADLTVREHCVVASRAARNRQPARSAEDMLDRIGLSRELMTARPGQLRLLDRRRVELALAMLNAVHVLLVDEIGAGLNNEEARLLYRVIAEMVRQRRPQAAILVEHRLDLLIEFAGEIGLLEQGVIALRAHPDQGPEVRRLSDRMFSQSCRKSTTALAQEAS
jgi:ABC-type branched-subunit amino acid transport system ATPase component